MVVRHKNQFMVRKPNEFRRNDDVICPIGGQFELNRFERIWLEHGGGGEMFLADLPGGMHLAIRGTIEQRTFGIGFASGWRRRAENDVD